MPAWCHTQPPSMPHIDSTPPMSKCVLWHGTIGSSSLYATHLQHTSHVLMCAAARRHDVTRSTSLHATNSQHTTHFQMCAAHDIILTLCRRFAAHFVCRRFTAHLVCRGTVPWCHMLNLTPCRTFVAHHPFSNMCCGTVP